jgi:hypothetical protein
MKYAVYQKGIGDRVVEDICVDGSLTMQSPFREIARVLYILEALCHHLPVFPLRYLV